MFDLCCQMFVKKIVAFSVVSSWDKNFGLPRINSLILGVFIGCFSLTWIIIGWWSPIRGYIEYVTLKMVGVKKP